MREKRSSSFYWLAALFGLFVLFLYGPMITIFILSFQGPDGGLTFPMNGVSLHWFAKLWEGLGVVDIWAAFRRSFRLGLVVMVLTVVLSLAAGFAYRKRFRGADVLFYVVVASLIVPSIVVSLGIGLEFRLIDDAVKSMAEAFGWTSVAEHYTTAMGIYTSGLGAQLTKTLPLELEGLTTTVTNPQIYALGTVTTGVSFVVIFAALGLIRALRRRSAAS